jgi:hypothetical protein
MPHGTRRAFRVPTTPRLRPRRWSPWAPTCSYLYLPAGSGLDLPAAKAEASALCRQASITDLQVLLDHDLISHPDLDDDDPADPRIAKHATALRQAAEPSLHELLDAFAASLHERDVARFRFDRGDTEAGIDAYLTGGYVNDSSPTDSIDAWAIVYDTHALPDDWCGRIAAAAGLLHPTETGWPMITVTFHAWA